MSDQAMWDDFRERILDVFAEHALEWHETVPTPMTHPYEVWERASLMRARYAKMRQDAESEAETLNDELPSFEEMRAARKRELGFTCTWFENVVSSTDVEDLGKHSFKQAEDRLDRLTRRLQLIDFKPMTKGCEPFFIAAHQRGLYRSSWKDGNGHNRKPAGQWAKHQHRFSKPEWVRDGDGNLVVDLFGPLVSRKDRENWLEDDWKFLLEWERSLVEEADDDFDLELYRWMEGMSYDWDLDAEAREIAAMRRNPFYTHWCDRCIQWWDNCRCDLVCPDCGQWRDDHPYNCTATSDMITYWGTARPQWDAIFDIADRYGLCGLCHQDECDCTCSDADLDWRDATLFEGYVPDQIEYSDPWIRREAIRDWKDEQSYQAYLDDDTCFCCGERDAFCDCDPDHELCEWSDFAYRMGVTPLHERVYGFQERVGNDCLRITLESGITLTVNGDDLTEDSSGLIPLYKIQSRGWRRLNDIDMDELVEMAPFKALIDYGPAIGQGDLVECSYMELARRSSNEMCRRALDRMAYESIRELDELHTFEPFHERRASELAPGTWIGEMRQRTPKTKSWKDGNGRNRKPRKQWAKHEHRSVAPLNWHELRQSGMRVVAPMAWVADTVRAEWDRWNLDRILDMESLLRFRVWLQLATRQQIQPPFLPDDVTWEDYLAFWRDQFSHTYIDEDLMFEVGYPEAFKK